MQDRKNNENPLPLNAIHPAEPEASGPSPKSAVHLPIDPLPIGLGGNQQPGETLTRYYLSPVPYTIEEEDSIPWVEAPSAAEAAGMARLLYPHWDGRFSHIEWNDSKTGERHLMATTTEGALLVLGAVLKEKDAGRPEIKET